MQKPSVGLILLALVLLDGGLVGCGSSQESLGAKDISAVFAKVAPEVVTVRAYVTRVELDDSYGLAKKRVEPAFSQGSGVVIASRKVVTNCHVVTPGNEAAVLVKGGKELDAKVIALDLERDLCLLEVDVTPTRPIELRPVSSLAVGERVFAVGSPVGLAQSLSEGVISGLRSEGNVSLVQTTAAISPGSSGGGLFDAHGRLVGITTFKARESEQVNFALPAEWIADVESRDARRRAIATAASDAYSKTCEHESTRDLIRGAKCNVNTLATIDELPLCEARVNQEFSGSIIAGRKWAQADPWSPSAWSCIAQAASAEGEDDEAVQAINKALELRPVPSMLELAGKVHYERATRVGATAKADDLAQAREYLERSVAGDPENAEAWAILAYVLRRQNDREKAISAAQRAAALEPTVPRYTAYLRHLMTEQ